MLELPVAQTSKYAPVRTLMLYLTEDCNLRCSYCFVHKRPRTMSSETARKTVDWFLDQRISGVQYRVQINFFGGEPFMATDRMEEIIRLSREHRPGVFKKVIFSATTNGTMASPRIERVLRDADMELLISLDGGPEATEHRPFVSGRSSFSLVAKNFPKLVRWARRATARVTFHPGSLDLVGSVRQALELGAPLVSLWPVVESSWKGFEEPLEEAYQALADEFLEAFRHGSPLPLVNTWQLLQRHHLARTGGNGKPVKPCTVADGLMAVDPEGNVMPCHRFLYRPEDRLGTVERPDISPRRSQYLQLSSREILGCDQCLADPVCGGGCRYLALVASGDLQGRHPGHCLTMRAHYRAVKRIYSALLEEHPQALLRALERQPKFTPAIQELIA